MCARFGITAPSKSCLSHPRSEVSQDASNAACLILGGLYPGQRGSASRYATHVSYGACGADEFEEGLWLRRLGRKQVDRRTAERRSQRAPLEDLHPRPQTWCGGRYGGRWPQNRSALPSRVFHSTPPLLMSRQARALAPLLLGRHWEGLTANDR